MQPVGLQIQTPKIDPLGLARQGAELGLLMGFAPQLKQAEVERQTIANEQSRLNLDISQREDSARRRLAQIKAQHTKTDPKTGKQIVDHKAVYAQGAYEGIDPKFLEGHRTTMLTNASSELTTDVERENFLKQNLANFANDVRNLKPAEIEGRMNNFVEQMVNAGVPRERAAKTVSDAFGGAPVAAWPEIARRLGQSASITEQQRFEANARGVGPEAEDPTSAISRQAREAVSKVLGFPIPDTVSLTALKNIPGISSIIEQQVVPGATRLEQAGRVTEIDSRLSALDSVLASAPAQQLRTVIGSILQAGIGKYVTQNPAELALIDQLKLASKELGIDLATLERGGADAAKETLMRYREQLRVQRAGAEKKAKSPTVSEATGGSAPTPGRGMVVMRAPNGEQVQVPFNRVKDAEARGFKKE